MPSSTLPRRWIAPARKSRCSASVVLPPPAWPARTTLRRWAGSTLFIVIDGSYLTLRGAGATATGCSGAASRGGVGRGPAMIVALYSGPRCPVIPSGPRSSARRAPTTPSAAPCSPRSRARSASRPAQGGGDPDANYRLRLAIEKARSVNMPADNIKRTIEKATGGGDAEQFEEIVYEGYGPGGVAVLVEAATDNRNRTAAEVRSIFTKTGGQLAGSGAVAWQFEPRGLIAVGARRASTPTRSPWRRSTPAPRTSTPTTTRRSRSTPSPADLEAVRKALEGAGVAVDSAESAMIAKQTVELDCDQGAPGAPPRRDARGPRRRPARDGQLRHPRGRLRRGRRVIILGIDPGTAALGYGIVERTGGRLRAIDYGCLVTSPGPAAAGAAAGDPRAASTS